VLSLSHMSQAPGYEPGSTGTRTKQALTSQYNYAIMRVYEQCVTVKLYSKQRTPYRSVFPSSLSEPSAPLQVLLPGGLFGRVHLTQPDDWLLRSAIGPGRLARLCNAKRSPGRAPGIRTERLFLALVFFNILIC
jgi:hypothetical protein